MAGALLLAIIGQRGPGSVLGGIDAPETAPAAAEEPAAALPEPAAAEETSDEEDSETVEEPR